MDARERLLAALTWQEPDRVPLTVYDNLFLRGRAERLLRDSGVGLIMRRNVHRVEHRQVEYASREYWEGGRKRIRKTIHTPVGEVWQTLEAEGGYGSSNWILEHFIKRPEDYSVMEFTIRDALYHDNYESIREAQRRLGGDGLVYVNMGKAPIQDMLYKMMGMERFALDFHFQRDLFDSLHSAMLDRYEQLYDLAAESSVEVILLTDNITGDVVGHQRFQDYCAPIYRGLKKRLSGSGKLVGVHMDGRLQSLGKEIAEADFDIVEAFTPPPLGDISVREAREMWPGKALWLNFTSCMHVETSEAIEAHTRQLLEEAGSKRGFAIGVTEDAPIEALERSLGTISRVLSES